MSSETSPEKKTILGQISESYWISRILIICAVALTTFAFYQVIFQQKFVGFKFLMVVVALVCFARGENFIRDWGPFILVFAAYWSLRGIADNINKNEYSSIVIGWEEFLFGKIPTLVLQAHRSSIADYVCVVLYSLHYTIPIFTALYIYTKNKDIFKRFTLAFTFTCFISFAFFLTFPVAPPRLADELDGEIDDIRVETLPDGEDLDKGFNANPYAAMPSLHSALPWLSTLFLFKMRSKFTPIMLFVTIGIWFSTVYLGEHFIVDIIAGVLLTSIVFAIIERKSSHIQNLKNETQVRS